MSRSTPRLPWLSTLCALGLAGCISVPEDIQASMSPPDGKRPNNYGKRVEVAAWKGDDGRNAQPDSQPFDVVPDTPTIPAPSAAPVASGSSQ